MIFERIKTAIILTTLLVWGRLSISLVQFWLISTSQDTNPVSVVSCQRL